MTLGEHGFKSSERTGRRLPNLPAGASASTSGGTAARSFLRVAPSISPSKGGRAVRGFGEKPSSIQLLAMDHCRSRFELPARLGSQLALYYDSGVSSGHQSARRRLWQAPAINCYWMRSGSCRGWTTRSDTAVTIGTTGGSAHCV